MPALLSFLFFAAIFFVTGCASPKSLTQSRPFDFARDTFSFSNQLSWEYFFDANGKWTSRRREPPPEYSQRCFVLAHAAKQFFQRARFAAALPEADEKTYRSLIRKIVFGGDARSDHKKIVLPGYANLREFSRAHESLFKAECGGAWRSYVQRGHWRILLPFTRANQEKRATEFARQLKSNQPLVTHLSRYPQITSINHAVLLVGADESKKEIRFTIYDPNSPDTPGRLIFDRAARSFVVPTTAYFHGGKVNVYEIYRSWFY